MNNSNLYKNNSMKRNLCKQCLVHCFIILAFLLFNVACSTKQTSSFDIIKKAVDDIWLIDTHEHFIPESERMNSELDFFTLIGFYMHSDLISSGMSNVELSDMQDTANSLKSRWEVFYPYWQKAKNSGYGQCIQITVKGLFGIDEINEQNYEIINQKMQEVNKKKGWYQHVLKDRSRIDLSIVDPRGIYAFADTIYPAEFFVRVRRFDSFTRLNNLDQIEKQSGGKLNSLSEYLNVLDNEFKKAVSDEGIVGIKSGNAYLRILQYEDVSRSEAENLFFKMHKLSQPLTDYENKKLQDFMMHQVAELAGKYNLPFQIHTGMLAGNSRTNPIENTNAIHLSTLFQKHRNTKFVIFHGSYPYMAELSYLAKNYTNVYIDMCWMYIYSPSASKRYLEEWLFTVPSNKILAFGGDSSIEWAYGHSIMARKIVTEVLTKMVNDGYYTVDEAIVIAERILRTNAIELFNIQKTQGKWKRASN